MSDISEEAIEASRSFVALALFADADKDTLAGELADRCNTIVEHTLIAYHQYLAKKGLVVIERGSFGSDSGYSTNCHPVVWIVEQ